jgi:uncharacterized protein YerC
MTLTPYQNVMEKFIKKIKQDVKFFMYNGLSESEVEQIVTERSLEFLDSACDELEPQLDQITLSDRNDSLECFDDELTRIEIDTISDMMKIIYMREPILKLNKLQTYIGTDIKTWSPPDERRTYLGLLNDIENKMQVKVDRCNSIDRTTGKQRSLYG